MKQPCDSMEAVNQYIKNYCEIVKIVGGVIYACHAPKWAKNITLTFNSTVCTLSVLSNNALVWFDLDKKICAYSMLIDGMTASNSVIKSASFEMIRAHAIKHFPDAPELRKYAICSEGSTKLNYLTTKEIKVDTVEIKQTEKETTTSNEIEDLSDAERTIETQSEEEERIVSVFKNRFPSGMHIGFVDIQKLRIAFSEKFGAEPSLTNEQIEKIVKSNGIKTEDAEKYTHVDNLFINTTFEEIDSFLKEQFGKGCQRIFLEPLYNRFKSKLNFAVSKENFSIIIEQCSDGKYKTNWKSSFIGQANKMPQMKIDEEIAYVVSIILDKEGGPLYKKEICERLPAYTSERIEKALTMTSEILSVKKQYYHCTYLFFADTELDEIKKVIREGIKINGRVNVNYLIEFIEEALPNVLSNNNIFSTYDIIKAIAYQLKDTYTYNRWNGFELKRGGN